MALKKITLILALSTISAPLYSMDINSVSLTRTFFPVIINKKEKTRKILCTAKELVRFFNTAIVNAPYPGLLHMRFMHLARTFNDAELIEECDRQNKRKKTRAYLHDLRCDITQEDWLQLSRNGTLPVSISPIYPYIAFLGTAKEQWVLIEDGSQATTAFNKGYRRI